MRIHTYIADAFYYFACLILTLFSLIMIGTAFWEVWMAFQTKIFVSTMLNAIGLLVIAIAVFDVAKFLVEEEILRDADKRSPRQARSMLTKFMTIITIAVCLEALVLIFEAGKSDITTLLYPAALLLSSVGLVVGLGIYHKLSASAERDQADQSGGVFDRLAEEAEQKQERKK